MVNENHNLSWQNIYAITNIAVSIYNKLSQFISDIPNPNGILPTGLGEPFYVEDVNDFEKMIKQYSACCSIEDNNWIEPITWIKNYEFLKRAFDYNDWNRWYIDLNILNNIEIVPEQWNELNIDRYQSIWDGNASLEWEE